MRTIMRTLLQSYAELLAGQVTGWLIVVQASMMSNA